MTQPSLSSALVPSTLTYPGPLLVLLDGVHGTMTRGALCIQRTTDVHGYDNFPTGGSDKTDLRTKHPSSFCPRPPIGLDPHLWGFPCVGPLVCKTCSFTHLPEFYSSWKAYLKSHHLVKSPEQGLPFLSLQRRFLPLLCFPELQSSHTGTPKGFLTHRSLGSCFHRPSFSDTFS